jgi:N-acetylglucosamine-6-phosphate deacetylase
LAFVNGIVHTGDAVVADAAVVVDGGTVVAVSPAPAPGFGGEVVDLGGAHIAPGLVDLQVNGGGGVLFNAAPSVDALAAITTAHRRAGTTDMLATFITGPTEGMARAGRAVSDAIAARLPGLLGVHFEGPVLSAERAGAHDRALVRSGPAEELLAAMTVAAPTMVTLAPEVAPPGFIVALCARGVAVSAGHTAATPDEVRAAVDAGLRAGTHVWNAMPPLMSRAPGVVGALLGDPRVRCGFIADGHHVDFTTLAVSFAATGRGRAFLVSDAMPPVGAEVASFPLGGATVAVADGRCQTADGSLAGGAVPLAAGVRNCVRHAGVPLDEALRMASLYPARCLGVDDRRGRIAPGYPAHLVVLGEDLEPVWVMVGTDLQRVRA